VNLVDLGVIVVIALSAVLALVRGLVSEVLSVAAWVGAVFATLTLYPHLDPYMRAHVEPSWLADAMAIAGVFVLALVILSVLAHEISKGVHDSALSAVDRSLGLVFGIGRGLVLVVLAWMVVSWLIPDPKDQPDWLREARTRPLAEAGAAYLQSLVPSGVRSDAAAQADAAREKALQTLQDAEALRRLTTPKPEAAPQNAPPPADGGYKKQDRGDLDRLIKNTN
jgi:membrane protein required for colicin V production